MKFLKSFILLGLVCLTGRAVMATCLVPLANKNVEGPPYAVSYTAGANNSCITYFLDTGGDVGIFGYVNPYGNTYLGSLGTGISNQTTATNIANAIPVQVSSGVSQGMAIVVTSTLTTALVNGIESTTTGATTVIGIADTAASSGTVVNVDFSGLSLALTSGTVTVGDLLVTTTTWPGYLVTNNSAAAGAIVATALATNQSTYNGLTRVLIHH